jgi:hypothetical protein
MISFAIFVDITVKTSEGIRHFSGYDPHAIATVVFLAEVEGFR